MRLRRGGLGLGLGRCRLCLLRRCRRRLCCLRGLLLLGLELGGLYELGFTEDAISPYVADELGLC